MVSSQLSGLSKSNMCKSGLTQLLLPMGPPDAIPPEGLEFDFSDVFGPLPIQKVDIENSVEETADILYDDPVVIYSRSHSLVGPTSCVSQSLKLSKLTLHETEESLEIWEDLNNDTLEETELPKDIDAEHDKPAEMFAVGLDDFEVLKVVGQGAFGKVFQVRKRGTFDIYAMKVVRKDKILEKNHVEYMKAERDILTKVDHPYIVQLKYSFQTKYRLYLVLDFINGGHLFFQLYRQGLFREDLARIYAAEIVSAVSHLHANGIMHRDLKPENILLDADGHAMLTDFGLAKEFEEDSRSNSLCGTVEYMAPEIVLGRGHDKAADWWSVGVLLFEMLTGKPPFIGGNREKIQKKIIKDKIKLPSFLTSEAHSLLKGLLQKEEKHRLGSGPTGSNEIKNHKWFKPINWRKLDAREVHPSFRPEIAGIECTSNFEERWTNMSLVDSPASSPTEISFTGFTYVRAPGSFLQRSGSSC